MSFIYFLLILSVAGLLSPYRTNTTFNELFTSERRLSVKILDENNTGKYLIFHNIYNVNNIHNNNFHNRFA